MSRVGPDQVIPVTIIVLATVLGLFVALLGLAIVALRLAILALIVYEAAKRELDRELGGAGYFQPCAGVG